MGFIDRALGAIDRSGAVKNHFPALTGFRAFTCLHVVMYHLFKPMLTEAPTLVQNGLRASTFGFFFVLSGFLLGCGYGERMLKGEGRRTFYEKRVARIYPVYLLMILAWLPILAYRLLPWLKGAGAASGHEGPLASAKALLASLFMVQAWAQSTAHVINPPSWSLSVEAFLYLVFPWLFLGVFGLRRRLGTAGALACAVALQLVNATLLFSQGTGAFQASDQGASYARYFVSFHPLSWIAPFSMGLTLSMVFSEGVRLKAQQAQALLLGAVLCVISALLFLPDRAVLMARIGLLSLPFAGIIFALASAEAGSTFLFRALASKPMVLIGSASYTMYASHVVLFFYLQFVAAKVLGLRLETVGTSLLFGAVYLAVLIPVGILLHLHVEIPLNRKVSGWFKRRREASASQAQAVAAR
jgi:peptidoglycan/LPS O-acetylase OafA/YrhL